MRMAVRYVADNVKMNPTGAGAPLAGFVQQVIDWLGQYGLWFALIALVGGVAVAAVSHFSGNVRGSGRGREAALAGVALAVIVGCAPTVINLFAQAAGK